MHRTAYTLIVFCISVIPGISQRILDIQGHRGCRGLLPENTIEGFIKALEIGVTTLEMDVVISKDKFVVVSHETYFSHEISTAPAQGLITQENEKQHNLYQLTYGEIKKYDVGTRTHEHFPQQQKIPAFKPLLSDVIKTSEGHAQKNGLKRPYYNIEIKRKPASDAIFHPPVEEFVQLVVDEVLGTDISNRACIQSFDIESLQIVKQIAPDLTTALLIETDTSFEENLKNLGFMPDIYSPSFELVSEELVGSCRERGMLIIPWTVNEEEDMHKMIRLNVDGIITDYPGRLVEITREMGIRIK